MCAADLAGHSVGIPGRFGSSWIALQALLASAGLTPEDVEVVTYPDFGHGVAVAEGQVDAAVGYLNNEPIQLAREGIAVDVLSVDDVAPLPGPGLVVGRSDARGAGAALRAFTAATLRAMADIEADPQLGLDATFVHVPELASDPDTQLAILQATIDAWSNEYTDAHGLGAIDPSVWESALATMEALPGSLVAAPVGVEDLITEHAAALTMADTADMTAAVDGTDPNPSEADTHAGRHRARRTRAHGDHGDARPRERREPRAAGMRRPVSRSGRSTWSPGATPWPGRPSDWSRRRRCTSPRLPDPHGR